MSRRIVLIAVGLMVCVALPPLLACSLCTGTQRKDTLGQELDRAAYVFFGYAANPRLGGAPGSPAGVGTTDFHVQRIVKGDATIGNLKTVTLERYIPVLDKNDPPRFLVFCNVAGGKLDPYTGRQIKSRAVLDYLEQAKVERAKGRVAALVYYARFFDHADETIVEDAFLEFVRSSDDEVGQAAKKLDPARLRALLASPRLDSDRVSLFAFLLGNCGAAADAALLRKRIDQAGGENLRALDGMLGGYIAAKPKEGWQLTSDILANSKSGFLKKYAAVRTVRFYMGWQPVVTRPTMLGLYQAAIADSEIADLVIEDLRRWRIWELTPLVLAQFSAKTHDAPILKRGIVRYALSCPAPEARRFVERLAAQDADLVRDLADALKLEPMGSDIP